MTRTQVSGRPRARRGSLGAYGACGEAAARLSWQRRRRLHEHREGEALVVQLAVPGAEGGDLPIAEEADHVRLRARGNRGERCSELVCSVCTEYGATAGVADRKHHGIATHGGGGVARLRLARRRHEALDRRGERLDEVALRDLRRELDGLLGGIHRDDGAHERFVVTHGRTHRERYRERSRGRALRLGETLFEDRERGLAVELVDHASVGLRDDQLGSHGRPARARRGRHDDMLAVESDRGDEARLDVRPGENPRALPCTVVRRQSADDDD